MEKIIAFTLLFSGSVFAMDIEQRIQQDYQMIQQQVIEQHQERVLTRCEKKILTYEDKVRQYPSSVYYNWKLDSWKDRCRNEQ